MAAHISALLIIFLRLVSVVLSQSVSGNGTALPVGSCTSTIPCSNGACCNGQTGFCGFGAAFCKPVSQGGPCTSNCGALAECGPNAAPQNVTCPLNVCCSQFGFCGTTTEFCESPGCQSNCNPPGQQSCGSDQQSALQRRIGYYEGWAMQSDSRACLIYPPEQISTETLTHVNFAFALISSSFSIIEMSPGDASLWVRTTALKQKNPALRVYLSIGGWSFNDPPTSTIFSQLVGSSANTQTFISSALTILQAFGFDGIDVDWEYPAAYDRGGAPADKANYVTFMAAVKAAFAPRGYGLTFTAPSSFWYLQHFDLPGLLKSADWVNVMTYDLHGTWDGTDPYIGPIVLAHTNLTEIQATMQLFRNVNINPSQIVLGIGFYGRSFQLADPSCSVPGCGFVSGAAPGVCSLNSGTLMFSEIEIITALAGVQPIFDEAAAVKYIVWNDDQWVSYDDAQTLQMKLNYANSICLGGTMIWSVDQDDTAYTALSGLYPDIDVNTPSRVEDGNQCSITGCGQGCPNGWDALTTLTTNPGSSTTCDPKTPATLCCPAGNEPQNCSWRGGGGSTCNPQCAIGEITIATDPVGDDGKPTCAQGTKAFCCQSGQVDPLDCFATGCGESDACASGYTTLTHVKQGSSDNGGCESEEASPDVIQKQPCPTICSSNNKPVCCEENVGYTNCAWVGDLPNCLNSACPVGQVGIFSDIQGDASQPCVGKGQRLFCCTPPNGAAFLPVPENWVFPQNSPVAGGYQVDQPATFTVDFDDDIGTSDPSQTGDGSDGESDDGKENDSAFGEVFISSPNAGSVSSMDFHSDWVVTNCSSSTDQPQKAIAYCSKSINSDDSGCGHVFIGQAQHTIVRMPSTCGMGPYARVKSLEIHPAQKQALSTYHQALLPETENVYSFEFDYEYLAIPEENGPVLMRADITDIPGYWDAIVNSAPDAGTTTTKRKRDYHNPGHLEERWFGPFDSWLQRLTTVTSSNSISRNFHWSDKYTIFHQEESCPHFSSSLDVSVSGAAQANSRFGYYLEASVVPPAVQQAYVYLSAGASAQATFTISGLAQANFDSERAELISFGFPGLYYPGLLTLGPSLHLYGQLTGSLSMSGNYSTTVSYQFPSLDLSFGKMDSNPDEENTGLAVNPNYSYNGYDFSFGYNVELQGSVEAHLVPSLQLGLSVLGGSLLDAQVFVEADIYGGVGVNGSVSETVAPTFCVQPYFGVDLNAGLTGSVLFWRDNAISTSFYTNKFPFGGSCFSSAAQPDGSGNSKRDLLISHSGEIGERFEIPHNSVDSAYAAYESTEPKTSRNGRSSDPGQALASPSFPESMALVKRGGVPFLPGNLFCPDTGSSITPTGTGTDCDLFDDIADFDPDSPTKRSLSLSLHDLPLPAEANRLGKRAQDRTSRLRSCRNIAIEIPEYDTTPIVGYCDLQTPNSLSPAFTTYNPIIPLDLGTTTNGGTSLVLPTATGSTTTPIYAREHPYEVNMAGGFVDYLQQATNLWQNTAGNQNWCQWVLDNLADQPDYIDGNSVFDTISDTCYPNNDLNSNMIVMEQTANDIKKYALLSQQSTFLFQNQARFRTDAKFSEACSTKQISILRAAAGVSSFLNIPAVRDIFLAQNTCIRNAWIFWAHAYLAAPDASQQNPGGVDAPNRRLVNVGNLYDNWINSVVGNVPTYLNQQIAHLITLYNPGVAANVATDVVLSWPALVDNTQRLNRQGGPVNVDPTKVANNVPVSQNDLAQIQAVPIGWLNQLPRH